MSWLTLEAIAQGSVERILTALPEGILIAFFAWALLRVLRKQNSATRFAVWFVALLAVAALPLLGGLGATRSLVTTTSAAVSMPTSWALTARSVHPAIIIPGSWALFAFIAWTLGAATALVRLSAGLLRLRKLRQSCTVISAVELHPEVGSTVDALRATAGIAIATSELLRVPSAIGLWHRAIILPAWVLQELRPEDINVVLLHESAHLRRGDDWTNLIQKIVRALLFFHPAVWWIESRLSVEREMACDDAVLAQTANPRGYATCLVSLLEKSLAHRLAHSPWSMAQAAVHRAREASLRLAQILDADRPAATRVWKPALAMVATFSLLCLAALSNAPQFIAFDHSPSPSNPAHKYSATVSQSANGTPGVPAQLNPSTALREVSRDVRHSRAIAARQPSQLQPVAQLTKTFPREQIVTVSANADPEVAPQFQTLLFVETTQYLAPDWSGWSVQVWRVTFVSIASDRLARVPVSHSI